MVFSSLLFLFFFFPIFFAIYYLIPRFLRNLILFIGSLVFYAWGEPVYVSIMLFSTVFDYTMGRIIGHYLDQPKKARWALIASVTGNLSILGFFKYSDFFITNVNAVTGSQFDLLHIALPIGISFYTFQTMSYTIDVYRRKTNVQKNIISFGAYVAMFPQLIAGPIVTYATVEKELNDRKETLTEFGEGVARFIEGLGKKVLLANNIGLLWETVKGMEQYELSVGMAWLGMIAFALQLYFDFSGYSDMAIGLGKMLGFMFPENFNYPYIAKSATDFWRRWHMTLGYWFREYVYIPLGGNRVSKSRLYINIFVVWFLTGFWHGAGWNYILWGLFFSVLLILEKTFLLDFLKKLPSFVSHVYLILAVLISWVFFSIESLPKALSYLKVMFGLTGHGLLNDQTIYLFINFAIFLLVGIFFATPLMVKWREKLPSAVLFIFYTIVLLVSTAYLVDSTFNPFLYFRF